MSDTCNFIVLSYVSSSPRSYTAYFNVSSWIPWLKLHRYTKIFYTSMVLKELSPMRELQTQDATMTLMTTSSASQTGSSSPRHLNSRRRTTYRVTLHALTHCWISIDETRHPSKCSISGAPPGGYFPCCVCERGYRQNCRQIYSAIALTRQSDFPCP